MSVNKVLLIGRLGQDPELSYTPGGDAYCKFSLATGKKFKDKSGQQKEKTTWHRIIAWRKTAELVNQYLKKGSQVWLEGEIEVSKWKDNDGNERESVGINAHTVQFLDGKSGGESKGFNRDSPENEAIDKQNMNNSDIPF